jgi:hypothetical protein
MLLIIIEGAIYQSVAEVAEFLGVEYDDARHRVAQVLAEDNAWRGWVVLEGCEARTPDSIQSAVSVTAQHTKKHLDFDYEVCEAAIKDARATILKDRQQQDVIVEKIGVIKIQALKSTAYIDSLRETE